MQSECILSRNGTKKGKKCETVQRQPGMVQKQDALRSTKITSDNFESIISKTSVTLSWRESCILSSTPLSELNPALIGHFTEDKNFENCKSHLTKSSTFFDAEVQDLDSSSSQLSEWMEKAKTPGSSCDILSKFSSADLLGIWFNAADRATHKVYTL